MRKEIYKIRQSESTIQQPGFEFLQNGLLCRYDNIEVPRSDENGTTIIIQYNELFISKDINEDEVPELLQKVVSPIVAKLELKYSDIKIEESQKNLPEEFRGIVTKYLRELFV